MVYLSEWDIRQACLGDIVRYLSISALIVILCHQHAMTLRAWLEKCFSCRHIFEAILHGLMHLTKALLHISVDWLLFETYDRLVNWGIRPWRSLQTCQALGFRDLFFAEHLHFILATQVNTLLRIKHLLKAGWLRYFPHLLLSENLDILLHSQFLCP